MTLPVSTTETYNTHTALWWIRYLGIGFDMPAVAHSQAPDDFRIFDEGPHPNQSESVGYQYIDSLTTYLLGATTSVHPGNLAPSAHYCYYSSTYSNHPFLRLRRISSRLPSCFPAAFLSKVFVRCGHKARPALRDLAGQCFSDVRHARNVRGYSANSLWPLATSGDASSENNDLACAKGNKRAQSELLLRARQASRHLDRMAINNDMPPFPPDQTMFLRSE